MTNDQQSDFPSTRWSVIVAAGEKGGDAARVALDSLCRTYWLPVYAFVRKRTASTDDARELTQEFFTQLLDGRLFQLADPARGRFRALLLTAVRNFLAKEHDRATAQKRGGGRHVFSFDFQTADSQMNLEPATAETPDREFDRQWGLALLNEVLNRLQAEFVSAGKGAHFDAMKPQLTGEDSASTHAVLARQLNCTADAARAALYRFRKRYRALLLEEIAQTVDSPADADAELQDLFRVFQ